MFAVAQSGSKIIFCNRYEVLVIDLKTSYVDNLRFTENKNISISEYSFMKRI